LKASSNRGCTRTAGSLSNTGNVEADAGMTGKMKEKLKTVLMQIQQN
jgi:hypothetical protein